MSRSEPYVPSNDQQPFELKRRGCIDDLEYQRSALIRRLSQIDSLLARLKVNPLEAEVLDLFHAI